MKVLFTEKLIAGDEASGFIQIPENTVKTCHRIDEVPGDPNHVLLTVEGSEQRIKVNGRNIQILCHSCQPAFRADMWLVEHGYQVDYYAQGQAIKTECRDFGGSHTIETMIKWIFKNFDAMLAKMREEF